MWLPRRSCRGPLTAGVGGAMPARPQPPPLAPQKSPLVVVAPLVTEELSLPHPHGPGGLLPQWLEFSEDEYFLESGQGAGGAAGVSGGKPPNPCSSRRNWVWVILPSGGPWPSAAAPARSLPVLVPVPRREKWPPLLRRTFVLLEKSRR